MSNPNWDGHILHGPNVPLYVRGAFNPQYGPELFFFSFSFPLHDFVFGHLINEDVRVALGGARGSF